MSVPELQFCVRCETEHLTDYTGSPDLSEERLRTAVKRVRDDNPTSYSSKLVHALWVLVATDQGCFTKEAVRAAWNDPSTFQIAQNVVREATL